MKRYKNNEIVLLLTATVTPQYSYMAHTAEKRLTDYAEAINYYLTHFPYKMVVGENSGCHHLLDFVDSKYRDRVELICYKDTDNTRHYGYNEMVILETCKNQSVFLQDAELIVKITGRIKVMNLEQLISQVRKPRGDFFAAEIGVQLLYINARCFFFTKTVWDEILALKDGVGLVSYEDIKAGVKPSSGCYVDVETAYAHLVKERLRRDKNSFKMLHSPIIISGTNGYYGTALDINLNTKIKRYVKSYLKFLYWRFFVLPRM